MTSFEDAVNYTLSKEGVYSNDTDDKGGETKFGISKKSYPELNIDSLTIERAKEIYRRDYWNESYRKLPKKIGIKLFDLGVNLGKARAVKLFQETLNHVFGFKLQEDGVFGQNTSDSVLRVKSHESLYSAFIFIVSTYYAELNQPRFFLGWLNRLYDAP